MGFSEGQRVRFTRDDNLGSGAKAGDLGSVRFNEMGELMVRLDAPREGRFLPGPSGDGRTYHVLSEYIEPHEQTVEEQIAALEAQIAKLREQANCYPNGLTLQCTEVQGDRLIVNEDFDGTPSYTWRSLIGPRDGFAVCSTRADAKRLRDWLDAYLAAHPE